MISLANPAMLWSLVALAVPITIHFLSRKEGKVIPLGSLKHIQETSTQQFRGIRLNEILLLILRCLIIVLLSLLLSGLSFSAKSNEKWVLLESGAEKIPAVRAQVDSLIKDGYEARWLADGFPSLSDSITPNVYSYQHHIENLNGKNLTEGIVFSFSKATLFAGSPVVLSDHLKWITIPAEEKKYPLMAVPKKDSVYVRWVESNSEHTHLMTKVQRGNHELAIVPPTVINYYVEESTDARQNVMLRAVIMAIDESSPFHELRATHSDSAAWIFWLSEKPMPQTWTNAKKMIWKPGSSQNILRQEAPQEWAITKPLTEETVLTENFSTQLAALLLQNEDVDQKIRAMDQRVMPEALAWSGVIAASQPSSITQLASGWVFMILVLVLLIERLISYQRQQ